MISRRWVGERTFGRLTHHCRPARDYETHPPQDVPKQSANDNGMF
ncbi:hypothetical protein OTB16_18440 [Streptomyces sp. H27-S2]|nr:hypothetical protein [Streptomyces sp. H27-S2]